MSEYMEPHAAEKLFGAPGGYVGYEQGGVLTNAVRNDPYTLILLDEIDKAHPSVFQVLNQILGEGICTDGEGREVSFANTIIMMTGNVGMQDETTRALVRLLADLRQLTGFKDKEDELAASLKALISKAKEEMPDIMLLTDFANKLEFYKDAGESLANVLGRMIDGIKKVIDERIEKALADIFQGQEIIGRAKAIGGVISFNGLTREDLNNILDIRLRELNQWLIPFNTRIDFSGELRNALIQEGYNPQMGARPLARALRRLVTSELADGILFKEIIPGKLLNADWVDGQVKFSVIEGLKSDDKAKETAKDSQECGWPEENLRRVLAEKPAPARTKGIVALEEKKLRIEIPVDTAQIEKEALQLSQKGKGEVEALKQSILEEKAALEKWINDKFDNLSLKAKRKQLTRAFSNPAVFTRFINALYQLKLNNPFLIGGDTRVRDSLIEHFVLAAYAGSVYGYENARILRLNMNEMLEFIPGIGMLEDRLGFIIKYIEEDDLRKNLRTVIVIDYDELEATVSKYRRKIDKREEVFNLGFFMAPFSGRKVKVIMSTSNRRIGEFEVFRRYFSGVRLESLDKEDTMLEFWLSIKDSLEQQVNGSGPKKIEVDFAILEKAIEMFEKYLPGEPYMETLLDFLKRVMPHKGSGQEDKERQIRNKIEALKERLSYLRYARAIKEEDLRRDAAAIELLRQILGLGKQQINENDSRISEQDVIDYLTRIRNVSLEKIGIDEQDKLRDLEKGLKGQIINQDEQLARIISAVKAGALGFKDKRRPIAALMFSGPTGCGKTETAKVIARSLGWAEPIVINLARITKIEHLSTLIGAPQGYSSH